MRIHTGISTVTLALFVTLGACRDRETLGSFDEVRRLIIVHGCSPQDFESAQSTTVADFRCKLKIRGAYASSCSCEGSATLRRAANRADASLLQLQLNHCPHDEAVSTLSYHVYWLLAESGKDSIPARTTKKLQRDLDEPAHDDASVSQHEGAGNVSAVRIYGDRVVEISWSRDAYRLASGSIELQSTESYVIAVRPRRNGDNERVVSVNKEPRITAVPECE